MLKNLIPTTKLANAPNALLSPAPQSSELMCSLPTLLQIALTPCLPLLADECRLSLPQTSQALPYLQKTLIYQLLAYLQTQGNAEFETQILQDSGISSRLLSQKFEFNFAKITALSGQLSPLRQKLFATRPNPTLDTFSMLIGLLADRTHLPINQLIQLFDWVTLLSIKVLADIWQLTTASHTTPLLYWQWLAMQEMLMAHASDSPMLAIIGYQTSKPLGQLIQEQPSFTKKSPPVNHWQTEFNALLQNYLNTRPLSIVPLPFSASKDKKIAAIRTPQTAILTPSLAKNPTTDAVFSPTIKPTWQQRLQQHWMGTAAGLTGLVFGGLALILPLNKTPTPTEAMTLQAKLQQDKQKAEQAPHDVAIVKVTPSQSSPTLTAVKKKSTTIKQAASQSGKNLTKTAESVKTTKTSDMPNRVKSAKVKHDKANSEKSAHDASKQEGKDNKPSKHTTKKPSDLHSNHKNAPDADEATKAKHLKKADTANAHAFKGSKNSNVTHKKSDNLE